MIWELRDQTSRAIVESQFHGGQNTIGCRAPCGFGRLCYAMIVYNGSVADAPEVIQFFRREVGRLKALRRLVVNSEKTIVFDVNKDGMEFPGMTYGSASLEELMRELGIVFNAKTLHNPKATPSGVKEFDISAKWTWGHDRVL